MPVARAEQEVLRARRVGYDHFGEPVLQHLDFAVRRGHATVFCGPRRSGKTTLVRLLAGELGPTRGRIEPPALREAGVRRDVAICNQRDTLSFAHRMFRAPTPMVVFDDPFDGLDPAERRELWLVLRDLADTKAVVVTARDPAFAAPADRVLLLARGTVVADGPPGAVLEPSVLRLVFGHEFAVVSDGENRPVALVDAAGA